MTKNAIDSIQGIPTTDNGALIGRISLRFVEFDFHLIRTGLSSNPRAPSHHVIARGEGGRSRRIESVWTKTMKRHGRDGDQFLTLTFDKPPFPEPLNVAAFRNQPTADWQICFRERQFRRAASGKPPHRQPEHRADTDRTQAQHSADTAPTQRLTQTESDRNYGE
jgi:uncharacterized protein (DUF736 family)